MWFFQYLGLNINCTIRDVKIAFRKQVLRSHPDKFQNQIDKQQATIAFRKLYMAYKNAVTFLETTSQKKTTQEETKTPKKTKTSPEKANTHEKTKTSPTKEGDKNDISDIIKLFNQICRELDQETIEQFLEKRKQIVTKLVQVMPDYEKGFKILQDNFIHFQYKTILENMNYPNKSEFKIFIQNKLTKGEAATTLYWKQRTTKFIEQIYQIYDDDHDHNKSKFTKWAENTLCHYDYEQIIRTISQSINSIPHQKMDVNSASPKEIKEMNKILKNENKKMEIIILLFNISEKCQKKTLANYQEQLQKNADKIVQVFPNAVEIKKVLSSWYLGNNDRQKIKKMLPKNIQNALEDLNLF